MRGGLLLWDSEVIAHSPALRALTTGTGNMVGTLLQRATEVPSIGSVSINAIPFDAADDSIVVGWEKGGHSHEESYYPDKRDYDVV